LDVAVAGTPQRATAIFFITWERTSVIVTTNLPFEQGTEVLGSERLVGATLDRLTHRCHILETTGESYRLRDAKRRQAVDPKGRLEEPAAGSEG
jgi:DNA replication protein DnaC